jgi:HD-GYP domain-containing protein (c-di-GMP phosphodiesterase class II)
VLEFAAARGFRSRAIKNMTVPLGKGHAGCAARERRTISVPDLHSEDPDSIEHTSLRNEAFVAHCSVPLIAKGEVKGVLDVYRRAPIPDSAEWREFLELLAGQAAIAIDNAALFDNLQRSNFELANAYDATIEGWSRALDLRDKETEGHTQRVVELTLQLAQRLGFSDRDLAHLRRGVLLHDIGKVGIPDGILLKAGALTNEEWKIMRQHPQYAYELLLPISYLRPALDIPYCHHEKWDGTGYPRGLKGENIPLAARVFAVVDVWDALRSDRPYRAAVPAEQVREYIRSQVGLHFDPQVAEVFQSLIQNPELAEGWSAR